MPKQVTYNNGQDYDVDKAKNREFQIPDDYDTLVVDSPEDINRLTFSGGQSPEGKNYAEVVHKGAYVYKINFISWNQIPDEIKPYLQK
ncbi:hypothetical protein RV16_GL000134 [Enterococcus saccharolyticus]|nr:hypothetical protein RV16_GL000134 [Enterococcus saccharolyticus]